MKFYTAQVSGKVFVKLFKNGVMSDFNEQITIADGVPQDAHLIQVRMPSPDVMELLFATDEEGDVPEAVDIWAWAERVSPTATYEWIEKETSVA